MRSENPLFVSASEPKTPIIGREQLTPNVEENGPVYIKPSLRTDEDDGGAREESLRVTIRRLRRDSRDHKPYY